MRNILRECMGIRSANGGRIMAEKRGVTLVETTSRKIIGYIIENKMMPGDQLPTEVDFM